MTEKTNSLKKTARWAGFLYLLVAFFGGYAHFFVRLKLIAPGDAATTVSNIMAQLPQFRWSFVADLVQLSIFSVMIPLLYSILRSVNKKIALIMLILALTGVPIACINMLNQYAVLHLLEGGEYLSAFQTEQLYALSMLFLDFHDTGYSIAHIFFGLWLLPLGYLIWKSPAFPMILGILLMMAAFGYLIHMFTGFLSPQYSNLTSTGALFSGFAEMSFILWLLIKGVRLQKDPGQ
ncbi:DUF4386 family protein [Leptobacterium flavescens]|uniref:DUF4386 family protein n=1 Tax=Leptobacterium flavescens TaxID=472055 RepID=A0A6P0UHD6_9FLAO|nr:DUF4386 domain-containing protein [Leptobacterium flavescens]NER12042.1 DUF4386 family protein [Leptobacterium flavescens]